MKAKNAILGLALSLVILSCNKDDNSSSSVMSTEDAKASAKIDAMNDDVSDIVEEQEATTYDDVSGKTATSGNSVFSDCATITRVPAFGTEITPGTTVTKTVDFGTSGCTLDNGNVVKGKIITTFVYQPDAASHTITYSFDNFYHNGIKFEGNKTFTRTMITTTANPYMHAQVTMTMDLTATMPGGGIYTRQGERVREITGGDGDAIIANNVYKITGSWVTTNPANETWTSTITTPLTVKMSCANLHKPLLVAGVITIVKNNTTATINYGDGECDNLAVLTVNGNTYNIVIGI